MSDENNTNPDPAAPVATGDDQPVTMGALKAMFGELLAAQRAPAPTPTAPKQPAPPQASQSKPATSGSAFEQLAQLMVAEKLEAMSRDRAATQAAAAREAAAAISPSARLADAMQLALTDETKPEHKRLEEARSIANRMLAGIKIVPGAGTQRTWSEQFHTRAKK